MRIRGCCPRTGGDRGRLTLAEASCYNYGILKKVGMKLKYPGLFFLILLSLFFCLSPVLGVESPPAEKVVAKVNGEEITKLQIERAIDEFLPRAFYHGNITQEKRDAFRQQALDLLIKRELYYQAAVKAGLKIGEDEKEEALKKVRERFKSEREFQSALKSAGFTAGTFEKEVGRNLLVSRFVDTEITRKSAVTDQYLREYYEDHKKDFMRPESFRVRHILIKVPATATEEEREKAKKDAEEVLAKAKKGEDFGDLAYKYSMDDWRVKGGDLGVVHKGRLDPSLEEAALKLKPGQLSGIIQTIYGYHILKLEEKFPPTQLGFDDVKKGLKKKLEDSRRQEIEAAVLKRLKDEAKIEIY